MFDINLQNDGKIIISRGSGRHAKTSPAPKPGRHADTHTAQPSHTKPRVPQQGSQTKSRLEDPEYIKKNVFDVNDLDDNAQADHGDNKPSYHRKEPARGEDVSRAQDRKKNSLARGDSFSDMNVRNSSKEPLDDSNEYLPEIRNDNVDRKNPKQHQSAKEQHPARSSMRDDRRPDNHSSEKNRPAQSSVDKHPHGDQNSHANSRHSSHHPPHEERKTASFYPEDHRESIRSRGSEKRDPPPRPAQHPADDTDPYERYHTRPQQDHPEQSPLAHSASGKRRPLTTDDSPRDVSATKSTRSATSSKPMVISGNYKDGYHRIKFDNGVYEGNIKDNKRNGKGQYTWSDGNSYDGDWVDDRKEGKGRFKWDNGDVYQGDYLDDRREGFGIKKYANGDIYEVNILLSLRAAG